LVIGEPKERWIYEVEGRGYISRPFLQGWKRWDRCALERVAVVCVSGPVSFQVAIDLRWVAYIPWLTPPRVIIWKQR
jgi:hypothetical protein